MKKKLLLEQKEKTIIENFAKTFNKIKRIDEQEIQEIDLGKSIATLGLMAALTGSPEKSIAQTTQQKDTAITQTIQKDTTKITDVKNLSDLEAGKALIKSYTKNAFSANVWAKKNNQNLKFFNELKPLADSKFAKLTNKTITDLDIEKFGAKYKKNKLSKSFLLRSTTTFKQTDKPKFEE